MHNTLLIVAALPLLIWLFLLTARGGFWRTGGIVFRSGAAPPMSARVAVVVPARNEAAVVGRAISSIVSQAPADRLHVFLVDDASGDGTASLARAAAERAGRAESISVIHGQPLPPGWTGKVWAMQQGIEEAGAFQPDFVLLTDADIVHAPGAIAELAAFAERERCDLASLMVRLHCDSLAERFLIPAFVFFFFMLYPPRWIADRRSSLAGAAGGCILLRPAALDRIGGLAAVRAEIIDDCALARALKSAGGSVWLGLADETASVRPYGSFAEIGRMIARTAFNQLRHSVLLLLLCIAALVAAFLLPVALLFSGDRSAAALGLFAWLLMIAAYLPMVRHYRRSPWWSLTLPAAALFYMGATVVSAAQFWTGAGGQWKGRVQDPARDRASAGRV